MKKNYGSWTGIPITRLEGFTEDKKYQIHETRRSNHIMRPVEVENDYGKKVTMFAARFEKA